jgi:putative methyltransferase (TIGR04325 family)
MKPFRSTSVGRNLRRVGRAVVGRAQAIISYLLAELHYEPHGWRRTQAWNDQSVTAAQEQHFPTLVRNLQGPEPLGVAHFPWHKTREDRADHNVMMSYGYVLALAARKRDTLSILDWGGGIGHYYLYSQALLPEVAVQFHSFDVPNLCALGRRLLPDVHLSDNEADFLDRQYDLVISSSALHYFEAWRGEVAKLAAATRDYLYVARLQVVKETPSFVVSHKIHHTGYGEFLSWFINRAEFIGCAEQCGLELVREFLYYNVSTIRGAPEKGDCRGFLFRRAGSTAGGAR